MATKNLVKVQQCFTTYSQNSRKITPRRTNFTNVGTSFVLIKAHFSAKLFAGFNPLNYSNWNAEHDTV